MTPPRSQTLLIIPAYNEEPTLGRVLDEIERSALGVEVVVVDAGSRDATSAVAARHRATVVRHPINLGYGAALQTGYKFALRNGAASLVQMDADGQHDPAGVAALLEPIRRDELDLVIGSRFLGDTGYRMGLVRNLGRQFFRALARPFGVAISDPTSGFQAMNRRVLEEYARDFFPSDYPDVDVLLVARRRGLRIGERAVRMRAGERASTLHGGFRDFYYVYKMLLSMWSGVGRPRRAFDPGGKR
jgi:glycosyltransferase involved in cell wall biosynthesis